MTNTTEFTESVQRLTFSGAQRAGEAALAKARELNLRMAIAVVDDAGSVLLVMRDGPPRQTMEFAVLKAQTAVAFGMSTFDVSQAFSNPQVQVELAVHARLTTIGGGEVLIVNGYKVGGIAAAGGSMEQDIDVARAGAAALNSAALSRPIGN